MNILAIESSCDETSCSIVAEGVKEIRTVTSSSADLHLKTGGVVPEVAARKQVEFIVPVLKECLEGFDPLKDIDALAVTVGPGLIGSLLVGVEAAKTLSVMWEKPIIPVNHLVGHIYANFIGTNNLPEFPLVALVVSGGHTDLVYIRDHGDFEYLGGTLDDAVGEAFDKTARLLGLSPYLGGPGLSKLASTSDGGSLRNTFPRPMMQSDDYDFSFSGLKTYVRSLVQKGDHNIQDVAHEFEAACCEVLIEKTKKAVQNKNAKTVLLGGGVAANSQLRAGLLQMGEALGIATHIPQLKYCGDTAAYIASAAYFNRLTKPLGEIKADPGLSIMDIYP